MGQKFDSNRKKEQKGTSSLKAIVKRSKTVVSFSRESEECERAFRDDFGQQLSRHIWKKGFKKIQVARVKNQRGVNKRGKRSQKKLFQSRGIIELAPSSI